MLFFGHGYTHTGEHLIVFFGWIVGRIWLEFLMLTSADNVSLMLPDCLQCGGGGGVLRENKKTVVRSRYSVVITPTKSGFDSRRRKNRAVCGAVDFYRGTAWNEKIRQLGSV